MANPLIEHLLQLAFFGIILAGPLPLAFSLVGFIEGRKEEPSIPHCVLLLLTSWCVIQTCLGLILGMLHHLDLQALLVSETAIVIAGVLIFFRRKYHRWFLSFIRRPKLTNRLSNSEKVISVTIAFVAAFLLLKVVLIPITDYNSLQYHLPTMANWYQTSTLSILEQFKSDQVGRYHFGWEVLSTLFMMPFREDFLVAAPNLVAWAILGISIYLISVSFGATRIHSMGSSALTMTILMITEHVNGMRVDLPVASFFIVSLYFGILYNRTRQLSYLGIFLATLGMLLGIKSSGILYGILLVASVALLRIRSSFSDRGSMRFVPKLHQSAPWLFLPGLFCFFFLGGFWFLRNLVEVGNPLGYVKLELGGLISFPGTVKPAEIHATSLANAFRVTNLSHWQILLHEIVMGLNVPFIAMAILSGLALLFLPFRSIVNVGENRIKTEHFIWFFALMVGTGVIYWNTPFTADNWTHGLQITPYIGHQLRFAFPALGLLGIAAALSATILRTKEEVLASIVIISSVISVMMTAHVRLLYVFLCIAVGLLLVWSLLRAIDWTRLISRVPRAIKWVTAIILIGFVAASTLGLRAARDSQRTKLYHGILGYIERNISEEQKIGYLLCHRPYLLFGRNLNRTVVYVPSESDSLSQWLDTLEKRKVDFVAVGPIPDEWKSSRELSWLKNSNGTFIHVYGQDSSKEIFLYRFVETNRNDTH